MDNPLMHYLTRFQIRVSTLLGIASLNKFCWGREFYSVREINSTGELNSLYYIEGIISDGDYNFIGCAEEISAVCWGNDQLLYLLGDL